MTTCQRLAAFAMLLLAACQAQTGSGSQSANIPSGDSRPFSGIAEDEPLHLTGTEPFWGGQVAEGTLTYTTPENQAGRTIAVERFAGRGGVSFSGTLEGRDIVLTATPSRCSDGMSERTYPFAVMLRIGSDTRAGCGWTDRQPFEGPRQP